MTPRTINHGDIVYTVASLDSCLGLALDLKRAGLKWHSHVLSPGCRHNPHVDKYAIVIENDSEGVAYIAPSNGFPEVDKQLVKMLHGDDILDAGKTARASGGAVSEPEFLQRLLAVDAKGIAWHHHMHFPNCLLNPHKGQWAIAIEGDDGTFFSQCFADEPVDLLREVEVIYFHNLAHAQAPASPSSA